MFWRWIISKYDHRKHVRPLERKAMINAMVCIFLLMWKNFLQCCIIVYWPYLLSWGQNWNDNESQEDKPRKKHVEIRPTVVHFYILKDTFLPVSLAFSLIWRAISQAEYKSPSKRHRSVLRLFFVVKYLQSISQSRDSYMRSLTTGTHCLKVALALSIREPRFIIITYSVVPHLVDKQQWIYPIFYPLVSIISSAE